LPGFVHDLGSAVHPLAVTSPFFSTLPLAESGLHWIFPPAALAHPLDDGTAVMLEGDVSDTAGQLGKDASAYFRLYSPLVSSWDGLRHDLLKPIGRPRHPIAMARFGLLGLRSAREPGLALSLLDWPPIHFYPWSRRSLLPLGWC
jgi:phytoene dehydrogenase-like protein